MPQDKNTSNAVKVNKALLKKKKLQHKPYSELSVEQRMQLVTLNKTLEDLSWDCYVESKQKQDSLQAAHYFLIALERASYVAIREYDKSQTGKIDQQQAPSLAQTNPHEWLLLGLQYTLGINTAQNGLKAIECFQKAIEMGDARGAFFLGLALESGTGIEKDEDRAIECFLHAAQQGYALAQCKLGDVLKEKAEVTKAAAWFKMAAEQGDPSGQLRFAKACQKGSGVPQNRDEALKWHLLALEVGNEYKIEKILKKISSPLAEYTLLTLKYEGCPVDIDSIKKGVIILLENPELQQHFLAEELHRGDTYMRGYYQLEQIISILISEAKQRSLNINSFLINILVTINRIPAFERKLFNNPVPQIKSDLINAIDLSQTQAPQLMDLLQYLTSILSASFRNYEDFQRLICLWYRAQSLEVDMNNKLLLHDILCMVVSALCNENHAVQIVLVKEFHINGLIPFLEMEKKLTIGEINQILGARIVVAADSKQAPAQLLRGLKQYIDDLDLKKTQNVVYFHAVKNLLHSYPPVETLDNLSSIRRFEELRQLSSDLKHQPQLHSLFKKTFCPLAALARVLKNMDMQRLDKIINPNPLPTTAQMKI